MKKVDFFIVGAPKAGTTSLYHYLNENLEIEMSSQKEPDFFSYEALQNQKLYYAKNRINTIEKYHSLFKREDNILRGEASVSYLFYKDVPNRIIEYNPNAKIIIMLRNPIDRAFSHYLMDYRLGLISASFDSIIYKQSQNINAHLFYQQYVQVSEYANQVQRYLEVFSSKNIYFVDYDDFKYQTSDIMNNIFSFLNLSSNFKPDLIKKYNTYTQPKNSIIRYAYSFRYFRKILSNILPKKLIEKITNFLFLSKKKPKLSESTIQFLKKYFESDVRTLSKLLNKDFTKWIM
jgi:hypothetical protein